MFSFLFVYLSLVWWCHAAILVLRIEETDRFLRFCQPSLVGKLQAREKELSANKEDVRH